MGGVSEEDKSDDMEYLYNSSDDTEGLCGDSSEDSEVVTAVDVKIFGGGRMLHSLWG